MPLWALWRRNWAVWMMPVTGLVVATWNNPQLPFFDRYPYWMAAQKTAALIVLGMVTCLAGAAEGAWQRRGRLNEQPVVRGFPSRFGLPAVMTWLPTAVLLLAGVGVVGGIAAWPMWTTSLVSLFAWTCLGMALGVMLPTAVALPASVLAAFGWFAFTPAIEPPWPRHLSATWNGCCTPSAVPNAGVLAAALLVAVGLCLTAAGLVWVWAYNRKPRLGRAAATLVPVAVALAAGGVITHDIGYTPTQPRTDQVVCWPGTPEVCLWPERRPYGDADVQDLRVITDRWSQLGVQVPTRLSEAATQPRDGTAPLVYNHSDTPGERVWGLAHGVATGCAESNLEQSTNGFDYFVARDWLIYNSGLARTGLGNTDDLEPLLRKPLAEQVRLLNGALAAWVCR